MLLRALPSASAIGVEVHPAHHLLAVRNAALNGLSNRYHARLGDLRDPRVLDGEPSFDLICGAPPYMPLGSGVLPKDPGRAAGRFELNGGVEDYAKTAASRLAVGGRVALLMNGSGRERALSAVARQGLGVSRLVSVRPRPRLAPKYWLIECLAGWQGAFLEEDICIRAETGMSWSPEYRAVRTLLDLP